MHEDRFDDDARRLLGPLRDDPVPGSRWDSAALLRAGRGRVRARRAARAGMAAVVTAAVLAAVPAMWRHGPPANLPPSASAAPAPTSCVAQPLALPPGADRGAVTDGEPSGRYLVGAATGSGRMWTVLWDNGTPRDLSPPASGQNELVVNGSATVAGAGSNLGWVYRDGKYSTLLAPGGKPAAKVGVVDINERGDILGRVSETLGDQGKPVVWPGGDPAAGRYLASPEQLGDVSALAIDDDGTVIGWRWFEDRIGMRRVALVWASDGRLSESNPPADLGPSQETTAIRHGWIGGHYSDPREGTVNEGRHVGRWKDARFEELPAMYYVQAINSRGWVAGVALADPMRGPAIYTDRLIALPMPPGFGAVPANAVSISDDGHTVGGYIHPDGSGRRPVVWSCR